MGQIDIKKGNNHTPPVDSLGYGFDLEGNPIYIQENGTVVKLLKASETNLSEIENKGFGTLANLPLLFISGDIYVTTDTFKKYVAIDNINWNIIDLSKGEIITDISATYINSPVYQFVGDALIQVIPSKIVTNSLNFTSIVFDEDGVSTTTLESIYQFYYDSNYIYLKRLDNKWIRSKIHKETNLGGLPE